MLILTAACEDPSRPDLQAWVATPYGARPLEPGEALGAGDRVQLRYRWEPDAWVTIAGVDGAGLVEVYGTARARGRGRWEPAPFSLVLDDAPNFQDLVVVFTDAPPHHPDVIAALRDHADLDRAATARMTIPKTGSRP
jgi:hypothetical protein